MPRVSIEVAAERRARVHELRAQGLSLREISVQTGLCLASVRNFLARDPGDSRVDELRAACLSSLLAHLHFSAPGSLSDALRLSEV
jgi:transposase